MYKHLRYKQFLFLCTFDREMSASSHSIVWPRPVGVSQVEMEGATAYAIKGLCCDHINILSFRDFSFY